MTTDRNKWFSLVLNGCILAVGGAGSGGLCGGNYRLVVMRRGREGWERNGIIHVHAEIMSSPSVSKYSPLTVTLCVESCATRCRGQWWGASKSIRGRAGPKHVPHYLHLGTHDARLRFYLNLAVFISFGTNTISRDSQSTDFEAFHTLRILELRLRDHTVDKQIVVASREIVSTHHEYSNPS